MYEKCKIHRYKISISYVRLKGKGGPEHRPTNYVEVYTILNT
jgi:hypothetical protein